MNLAAYNRFCKSLPNTTKVVQWGGAHVWKIGGKVFAIGGWDSTAAVLGVTFKCTHDQYEVLAALRGCRPAPHLASRGLPWIQRTEALDVSDALLKDLLRESYRLAFLTLSRAAQAKLGNP